jgi:hypothetical protein
MKAFPTVSGQTGMDLRDYFAAKAMKEIRWGGEMDKLIESARECYMIADAMMKARNETA